MNNLVMVWQYTTPCPLLLCRPTARPVHGCKTRIRMDVVAVIVDNGHCHSLAVRLRRAHTDELTVVSANPAKNSGVNSSHLLGSHALPPFPRLSFLPFLPPLPKIQQGVWERCTLPQRGVRGAPPAASAFSCILSSESEAGDKDF